MSRQKWKRLADCSLEHLGITGQGSEEEPPKEVKKEWQSNGVRVKRGKSSVMEVN